MTVTLGDTTLPGVQTTVESTTSVGVATSSPGDAGIVGSGDLTNGNADPDTVYEVTTPVKARNLFGKDSELTNNIIDAMGMGAYPVFAAAPSTTSVTGEDLSGMSSTSGTLTNAPVTDDPADTTFTIDGSVKTTIITYGDPHTESPASGDVHLNPETGEFELDTAPGDSDSTNDTVDYTYYNYDLALDAVRNGQGDTVDFITALSENSDVVSYIESTVNQMEQNYNFALGIGGAGTYIDTSSYTNPFSNSRMQLLYPTRTSSGDSILGKIVGIRAALGANGSLMRRTTGGSVDLMETLSDSQKESLDSENVVPVANESTGARIITDSTCISSGNMQDGLSRIIVDVVIETVHRIADAYIGNLHTQAQRNAMESQIVNSLRALVQQNSIERFNVVVQEQDANTADVEVSVETIKALRNVVSNVTAGDIEV